MKNIQNKPSTPVLNKKTASLNGNMQEDIQTVRSFGGEDDPSWADIIPFILYAKLMD